MIINIENGQISIYIYTTFVNHHFRPSVPSWLIRNVHITFLLRYTFSSAFSVPCRRITPTTFLPITIGNVYRAATKIVCYFNGLGVRFSNDGWDDSRHWLQRAWTLQEIAFQSNTIDGGTPRDRGYIFLNSKGKISGKVTTLRDAIRPITRLATQVRSQHGCEVYELVRERSKRHASTPVDKISGLFYRLRTMKLPCYDEQMTTYVAKPSGGNVFTFFLLGEKRLRSCSTFLIEDQISNGSRLGHSC